MSGGLKSTEFWFGSLVVVCATALLLADQISEDTWKWAVATIGAAYVLGRSLVKASDVRGMAGPTNVSNTYESRDTVNVTERRSEPAPEPEEPVQGVDAIRQALERNADALSSLQDDLRSG